MDQSLSDKNQKVLAAALAESPQFQTVRERQGLVRNAIAGYPSSHEIEKNLRFLDWEGAAGVVAFELVRRLDGHVLAPGVPALALIAQAVEPTSSFMHRNAIAEMRKRLGWHQVSE